jgi:chromate transporter
MTGEHPQDGEAGHVNPSLSALALVFLKLGTMAFGGPAAHIALMENEFVRRRGWLTREAFLDRLGAANLLPGPSSTELAIFIGYEKRGVRGLLVAGFCFIVPAAILVSAIAAGYVRYGGLPQVSGMLYALKPVVIAVIVQAFWNLARTAAKSSWLAAIGVVAGIAYAAGMHELLVLLLSAILAASPLLVSRGRAMLPLMLLTVVPPLPRAAGVAASAGLWRLFLVFAKTGAVLFGSGYVLLAFLRADMVDRLHWLTERQLLDAVAVGQITPGPLFTTATFIGYLVAGPAGAATATIGIFAPAFLFVGLSGLVLPRIRRSPIASAMLDGVVVGSLALMAVVAWQLGRAAIIDVPTLLIAVICAVVLLRYRINTAWLIGVAAVLGWMMR